MFEYKLMNREELTDYICNFWLEFGIPEYDKDDDHLWHEIYDNLNSKNGIEKELDYIRQEFESGWDENSREYQDLDKLWNYVNWYKTNFWKESEK